MNSKSKLLLRTKGIDVNANVRNRDCVFTIDQLIHGSQVKIIFIVKINVDYGDPVT